MNLGSVDLYAARSAFAPLDSRVKLLSLVCFAVAVALLRDVRILLFALAYILAALAVSGVPARHLAGKYAQAVPFATLAALSVWYSAGPLPGVSAFLRVSACVLALVLLSSVTGFFDLLKGLQRLRVPRIFVNLLLFTYRYLFVIADEMGRMSIARKARGARSGRHLLDRLGMRTISFTAGMVLLRAYERGRRMHDALRSRGFDGEIRTMTRSHFGAAEVLFTVAVVSYCVILLSAEWEVLPWA